MDRPRAVIVGVQLPDVTEEAHASSLTELARLAKTLGLEVIAEITQKRPAISKAAVVGSGKLKEIARYTGGPGAIPSPVPRRDVKSHYVHGARDDRSDDRRDEDDADQEGPHVEALPPEARATVVLVDHDISPSQARNLQRASGVEVLDRTAVILAIFGRHARTREAKLEVEIARLEYMAPRMRENAAGGDRQRGGIGGRGAGESTLEMDRRKVRDRVSELKRELADIERTARTRRARRADQSTVALVGYTNAGKSSLMRALTGSDVLVADKLFATLDTTVRVLRPETRPKILVSDTVGFIKKLPHGLVASFRATLEAAAEAHLLLHVIDASDPAHESQIEVTRALLREIGADGAPVLSLLNKIDRVDETGRKRLRADHPEGILMSAYDASDIALLRERIVGFFERDMVEGELVVPYGHQALVPEIHEACRVLNESYDEQGATIRVRADPGVIQRFRTRLGHVAVEVAE
jgi:GTP-binding protein HflX